MNPHQCEHLKSIPKIIKNLNIDGNVTLGKLNYRRTVFFYIVFNITYFFHHLCTLFHFMSQTEEVNRFLYKHTFYEEDHIR